MQKIEIFDTAFGGYGVGKIEDGRVVFVPFTVEGDVVSVEITEDKKSFCYGEIVEIHTYSEKRGEKYCPHIGTCGGCLFGHIGYEHQLEIKKRILAQNLQRGCGYEGDIDVLSADQLRYRHRATFQVENGKIGFYKFKTRELIPVEDCPVIVKSLVEKAKEFAGSNKRAGTYGLNCFENEEGFSLADIKEEVKIPSNKPFSGLKVNREISGLREIEFETDKGFVKAGFGMFLQGNRQLFRSFQALAETGTGKHAIELFCGSGYFTRILSEKFEKVTAVENSFLAVKLGKKLNLKNVDWVSSDCEEFSKEYTKEADLILADPPRTGLGKRAMEMIRRIKPERLILVSCNPTTLSRDINKIKDLFEIEKVTMADMFANTPHLETVMHLRLK